MNQHCGNCPYNGMTCQGCPSDRRSVWKRILKWLKK